MAEAFIALLELVGAVAMGGCIVMAISAGVIILNRKRMVAQLTRRIHEGL